MTTREASRADGWGVVEQLAAWVLATRAHDLSQAAILQAKLLLLDTIGCGFAALNEQSARALLEGVETSGGAPQCTVIGHARRTSASNATLANGALVRILDFNDYVNARGGDLGGHPSDNIPVALAAGELSGASGREVIAAVVLGYEIFGRCKELMERDSAWDGVTVSGLAAPAMAGRLMGLDRGRLAHAIALSAARAATSTAVRFGDISAAKSIANAGGPKRRASGAIGGARHHRAAGSVREPARNARGFLQRRRSDGADRAVAGRKLRHGRQCQSLPLLGYGTKRGRGRHRDASPAARRRRPVDQPQAHHPRHARTASAEGRSRPDQAGFARSRRPQLQFSGRGLAHRRGVRACPVRRRALERSEGLRIDGAARDHQR